MLRPILLFLLFGLTACSSAEWVEFHGAGGAITFADGQELTREMAAQIIEDVRVQSSAPSYRASILQMAAEHAADWKAEHPDAWQKMEISWHVDVIGPDDGDDGYATYRGTSGPASWVRIDVPDLPTLPSGVVAAYLEAETLITPYPQPLHRLALVPQAALLSYGDASLPAHFCRPLLTAIRETQLEFIRQSCAEREIELR